MWYGNCAYLKLMKGDQFIQEMAKKREEMCSKSEDVAPSSSSSLSNRSSCSESSQESLCSETKLCSITKKETMSTTASEKSDEEEEEKKDSKLCKICYVNEYNTIFLPCGHVIACAKCASSVTKCPACRQPFENVMRVYFSWNESIF
jgi:E3 ubiquitin-protein ligase XIAP